VAEKYHPPQIISVNFKRRPPKDLSGSRQISLMQLAQPEIWILLTPETLTSEDHE